MSTIEKAGDLESKILEDRTPPEHMATVRRELGRDEARILEPVDVIGYAGLALAQTETEPDTH